MGQVEGAAPVIETDKERQEALAEAERVKAAEDRAAEGMKAAKASGKRETPETPTLRVFLSPQQPNTSFLVKAGKLIQFRDPNSPSGFRDAQREGDVVATFVGGVLPTSDPAIIAWAEAHGPDDQAHRAYHRKEGTSARSCGAGVGLCCDAKHPMAEVWVEFKRAQIPLAGRDATMPPGIDIDAVLRGEAVTGRIGGEGKKLIDSAMAAERAARGVEEKE